MTEIIHLTSIADLLTLFDLGKSHHPLVAVLDFSKVSEQVENNARITTDFYAIMFKNYCKNHIRYGRKAIDFQEGSLLCIAPNQVIEMDTEIEPREDMLGWGLFFHPDLIRNTALFDKMKDYSFFTYEVSEALHLSDKEKNILFESVQKVQTEIQENIDDHSRRIVVSTIELLLNYCARFYGRQLITRSHSNSSVIAKIEQLLNNYFEAGKVKEQGLPTVKYLADSVHLSPNYVSDVLKKETGKTAQELIHFYLIEAAKNYLINTDININEIAYSLGFEYPQYFTKLFRQKTGKTPGAYRIREN